jgi:transposase-like protein
MLVAYGIRRDGSRHLLAFLRSQREGQADWEALLQDLYRRGLRQSELYRRASLAGSWRRLPRQRWLLVFCWDA